MTDIVSSNSSTSLIPLVFYYIIYCIVAIIFYYITHILSIYFLFIIIKLIFREYSLLILTIMKLKSIKKEMINYAARSKKNAVIY